MPFDFILKLTALLIGVGQQESVHFIITDNETECSSIRESYFLYHIVDYCGKRNRVRLLMPLLSIIKVVKTKEIYKDITK